MMHHSNVQRRKLLVVVCCWLAFLQATLFVEALSASSDSSRSLSMASSSSSGSTGWWSRLGNSNADKTIPTKNNRVLVKKRPTVSLDQDTGKLTQIASPDNASSSDSINPWNLVKGTVFGTFDVASSLASKLTGQESPESIVADGYSSTIEKTVLNSSSQQTPGQRLMKQYQIRALQEPISTGKQGKPSFNLFNGLKEGIYSTVDALSPPKNSPASSLATKTSFKPATQATLAASAVVKAALPDATSKNPIKRWWAEQRIRQWEDQQRKRQEAVKAEQLLQTLKETAYQVADVAQSVVEGCINLPTRVSETALATKAAATATWQWVESVPDQVETTVQTVQAIPDQVTRTVQEVQTSVERGIQTTREVVDTVQALPVQIQATVQETQRTVQDTVTNVQILVGAKPKPPAPPKVPPPPVERNAMTNIAWTVATGTAKVAWWATTGAAKLSWKGAQWAFGEASNAVVTPSKTSAVVTPSKTSAVDTTPTFTSKTTTSATPLAMASTATPSTPTKTAIDTMDTTVNTGEAQLDQEVSDALKLAKMALTMADEGRDADGETELDKALQQARDAAIAATREAVEIEDRLKDS